MSILNDPEIDKLIIFALAGICAVLAIAVIYLGVKKNTYIPEGYREEKPEPAPVPVPKKAPAPAPAEIKPAASVTTEIKKPVQAIEADLAKEDAVAATRVVPVMTKSSDVRAVTVTVQVNGRSVDHTVASLPCLIGRESGHCDLVIPETAVSRRHARFITEGGDLYLEDVSQHNGTFVNGIKLPSLGKQIIHEGDEISLGRAVIIVNKILHK